MRYAIYFAADADDRLMQLGNTWLGRDPFSGSDLCQPALDGIDRERFLHLTSSPRRYGFHGTLKAPFHLDPERSESALLEACRDFSGDLAPFEIQALSVNRLGRFLALTPDNAEPDLAAFAALCVHRFERFRAPLSGADLERRRKSGLTPKQDSYLTGWGYPYIFDEFRFHMTLSSKLENDAEATVLAAAARNYFAAVTGQSRTCSSFALYVEPERNAPFEVHTVFELTGSTSAQTAESLAAPLTRKENA
ncbi:DUF1045 domain-containing protein [Roseibium album]|uniref:DUF1045 domain-containing protein n=1 Tax=Roseibium album TaxID=311410 RepID=UPI000CF15DD2|nr:putative phosphonate metabolism protein [Labrenzia sp. EL_142]MCR9060798.1 DUF1045 domain-containing protein [Paracoccaceae bacterium]